MAIHGANILIFKDSATTPIAGQKNVTINFTSDTVDISTKDTFPSKTYIASWMDWTCSFDGVYNGDNILHDLAVGNAVTVKIKKRTTTNGTSTYEEIYSGSAIITEFSVEASQDDVTTFSASLQGSGAFTYPTPSNSGTQGGETQGGN